MTKATNSMSGSDSQKSPVAAAGPEAARGFNTLSIHAGQSPCVTTGAVIPPIYMTSTFAQSWPAQHKGYDYTRAGNPTFSSLEEQLAAVEGGKFCVVFSSGLGALSSYVSTLIPGKDRVLTINSLYGGSYRLLMKVFAPKGLEIENIDVKNVAKLSDFQQILARFRPQLFLMESPTNPLMEVLDIAGICSICREMGVVSIVDNTFASPFNQRPLELGATMVLHSSTKFIGGHSDVIGGAVVTNDANIHEKLLFTRMAIGTNPSPFDCWLLSRSLKTLGVRMERHNYNAQKFAEFLQKHPMVRRVYYPGLTSHPNHEIAKRQLTPEGGFGGVVSAEFGLSLEQTQAMVSGMKVFTLAESLGGVESLVCHPATMTHASIPEFVRHQIGLADGLIRFSVGLENVDDLLLDISESLQRMTVLEISEAN